jgi:hypothetical protein
VGKLEIRRVNTFIEDRFVENGRELEKPVRIVVAVAVIKNPWAGQGFVADLAPEIDAHAPVLGKMLADRVLDLIGGKEKIEAFGKGAMAGLGGELEHAAGLVHTLKFGNPYRDMSGGMRLLRSCDKRGPAGSGIDLPLQHINSDDARGHYQNFTVVIPDAPADDEILVCLSGATGGRSHPRIGNRKGDEQQLGQTYLGEPLPKETTGA